MTMSSPQDQLETRIRGGDREALVEYLALRRPQLLVFIEKHLGAALRRKIEPDDVLQEVGIECLRVIEGGGLEREPFGWLCQMAEHRIIDAHRRYFGAQKRSADREVPLAAPRGDAGQGGIIDLLVASMTSPSQAFSRQQREILLLEALESLPEESRTALRLRYIDGLATKDIAVQLNKTDGAIRVLLSRSLRRLEQLLGPGAAPS